MFLQSIDQWSGELLIHSCLLCNEYKPVGRKEERERESHGKTEEREADREEGRVGRKNILLEFLMNSTFDPVSLQPKVHIPYTTMIDVILERGRVIKSTMYR